MKAVTKDMTSGKPLPLIVSFAIPLRFTQGFSVLIAQYFGAGKESELKKSVAMSIRLSAILAVVFTVGGMLAVNPLLHFLNTPALLLEGAKDYLYIIFSGIFMIISYIMASAVLRALGDGKTPLAAMITAGCINIILDLLFVMKFGWGIKRAAAATVIAQICALEQQFI